LTGRAGPLDCQGNGGSVRSGDHVEGLRLFRQAVIASLANGKSTFPIDLACIEP
jgi:hypothetical protein